MLRVWDKASRFYGFVVLETYMPEYPEVEIFINIERKMIYINKSAQEDANVVKLMF